MDYEDNETVIELKDLPPTIKRHGNETGEYEDNNNNIVTVPIEIDEIDHETEWPWAKDAFYKRIIIYYERVTGKTRSDIKTKLDLYFGIAPCSPTFRNNVYKMWFMPTDHPYLQIAQNWDETLEENPPSTTNGNGTHHNNNYIDKPNPCFKIDTTGPPGYKITCDMVDIDMIDTIVNYVYEQLRERKLI